MDKKQGYEEGKIAVDAVIFTVKNGELLVCLNKRDKPPFAGMQELPGGLLLKSETAEETLSRKLKEITGIQKIFFQQFYTFTSPKRDPRGRTVSVGFIALVSQDKLSELDNFYSLKSLPKLAFDHKEIIGKAKAYLSTNMESKLVKEFLPDVFPLNDLQTVYEVIGGKKLDNRNFRKKMLSSGFVKQVRETQKGVAHRPAALYKFEV